MLPSVAQLAKAAEGLFIFEDLQNIGSDYDKTLMAWHENFNDNWNEIKDKYGERFYRMWNYFLLSSARSFRARSTNQLWQIVMSETGVLGGYLPFR